MVYRGIDISKSSFVAAYPSTNGNPTKTFPNTTAGMRELIGTLAVAEHQNGIAVSFAPPPQKKSRSSIFPE